MSSSKRPEIIELSDDSDKGSSQQLPSRHSVKTSGTPVRQNGQSSQSSSAGRINRGQRPFIGRDSTLSHGARSTPSATDRSKSTHRLIGTPNGPGRPNGVFVRTTGSSSADIIRQNGSNRDQPISLVDLIEIPDEPSPRRKTQPSPLQNRAAIGSAGRQPSQATSGLAHHQRATSSVSSPSSSHPFRSPQANHDGSSPTTALINNTRPSPTTLNARHSLPERNLTEHVASAAIFKSVGVMEKCHRCRFDEEDCDGQRPRCSTCRISGHKCQYNFVTQPGDKVVTHSDDRLVEMMQQVKSSIPGLNSELSSDVEYDYASQDGQYLDTTTDSDVRMSDDCEPDAPEQRRSSQTIVDVLRGYLTDEDDIEAMEVDQHSTVVNIDNVELTFAHFTNVLADIKHEVESFQENTVKLALRASKQYSKRELVAASSSKPNPFSKLVHKKGAKEETRLLVRSKGIGKWMPLPAPVEIIESAAVSLPKSKSIGRLGPTLLSRNVTIGKYHHYSQDDENQAADALSKKYHEVRLRYNDFGSISDTFSAQRACAELVDIWTQFSENLLERVGLTAVDVVRYFLAGDDVLEQSCFEMKVSPVEVEVLRADKASQCTTCRMRFKDDLSARRLKGDDKDDGLSAQICVVAAMAARAFHEASLVCLWHIVTKDISIVPLVSSDQKSDKDEVEQICLACGLHNCSMHGAYNEEALPDGDKTADNADGRAVRLNDSEWSKNQRWCFASYANPISDTDHICGAWCDPTGQIASLKGFMGSDADGEIAGFLNAAKCLSTAYLPDNKTCSQDCFWTTSNRIEAIHDLTTEEQAVFYANLRQCMGNQRGPCMMRDLLPGVKCRDIFSLMVSRCRKTVHSRSDDGPTPRKRSKLKASGKLDLTRDHPVENRDAFFPCDHDGPCTAEKGCDCALQKVSCERSCKCDGSCERRFRGCNCPVGPGLVCQELKCACWHAGRECDPALCKGCGVETVLHQAYKYDEQMRIGRCHNNRIQLDLPARTIKAPSEVQGYGLFAGQDIKKGDFIHEYKGELISRLESDRRGAMYSLSGQEYLFNLNASQEIDANNFGNKARFMNNSKKEENINVVGHTVLCNGQHRVGLFAKRDIKAGEELLYDYEYPDAVAEKFWERGEKSSKSKAVVDTAVIARASRGTQQDPVKRKKSKRPRQRVKDKEAGSPKPPVARRGQGKKRKRGGGLQSKSSRASLRNEVEDFDPMELDEYAQNQNDERDELDSDFQGTEQSVSSSSSVEDEVPESDAEDEVAMPVVAKRAYNARGRGRGGRK